jgi:hypothetical protein
MMGSESKTNRRNGMQTKHAWLVALCGAGLLVISVADAAIIRVPDQFPTIQEAIDTAGNGDTVLVASGLYTGEGNKNLDPSGKEILITSEAGAAATVIDCEGSGRGFHIHSGEGEGLIVRGFTVQGGDAGAGPGGGIYCWASSPLIEDNIVVSNSAPAGGGIALRGSGARIEGNVVAGNHASSEGGGGLLCWDGGAPTITRNTVVNNSGGYGGGVMIMESSPRVVSSIVWGNMPDQIWESGGQTVLEYCTIQEKWEGEGNITCDPLFVDTLAGDYALSGASPCIDSGDPEGAVPPDGGDRVDMGALEYVISNNDQVLIFVDPPELVRPGADLKLTVRVANPTPHPLTTDIWFDVTSAVQCRLIDTYEQVTIPSGKTVERTLGFPVPPKAPFGRYTVHGKVGSLGEEILDAENFIVEVGGHQVSYVESSGGLGVPELESGRTEVEMGDVNGDGHPDIVSIGDHGSPYVNTDEHGVMVWFGDGSGSWSVHQEGDFGYGGVALGDVNNDGLMDVGYGMHHNWSETDFGDQLIEVALGDGSGLAWIPWDDGLATNGETWGMFGTDFADVDNDGDLDLVSNSFGAGAGVHVYLNQGDGTWQQSFGFLGGNSTMDVVFGDVDNDGNADFAVAQQNGTVYLGDGSGGFALHDEGLPPAGSMGRVGIALGDVDSDGGDDLSFVNSSGGVEVWVWDDGQGWLDRSGDLPSSGDYESTQLCDMDGDGFMDVVAFGEGLITVWLGDGEGGWTETAQMTTPNPGYMDAFRVGGDADHNGYPDIIVVSKEGGPFDRTNHLRFFKEASTPAKLTIRAARPRPLRRWCVGSVRTIDWVSGVPGTDAGTVALELSIEGPDGPWTPVATGCPNNGRYQWVVSAPSPSDNCYIRYTVIAGEDSATAITPSAFEICEL